MGTKIIASHFQNILPLEPGMQLICLNYASYYCYYSLIFTHPCSWYFLSIVFHFLLMNFGNLQNKQSHPEYHGKLSLQVKLCSITHQNINM